MRLVRQGTRKKFLVAPDKTIATGSRKEVLSLSYATQYGPDRILGTKLGEIFYPNGKRKSNKDIFIDELGWHIEETSGDKEYEWINPDYTFYTYKITASDSNKYYYGVRRLKKRNATLQDCLNDNYMGSGGKKFTHWKKKHYNSLIKEIIGIYSKKSEAYEAERTLVGDSFVTDPLSLNSIKGGKLSTSPRNYNKLWASKVCEIHGMSKHIGDTCSKCVGSKKITTQECPVHGETIYNGEHCAKCSALKNISIKECETHGMVKHNGAKCCSCRTQETNTIKLCDLHGESKHQGNTCMKCFKDISVDIRICEKHGESKHQFGTCYKCSTEKRVTEKKCEVHGVTKFLGDTCAKCSKAKTYSMKECQTHGLTSYSGNSCQKCSRMKTAHTRFHAKKNNPECPLCIAQR